ncbi:MAG: helix-turn-helix domain-containing protein [Euryarchaeota archaeon]|nr:helix-turn-helix domain-containing protein [Euryarchaeota archaeon]
MNPYALPALVAFIINYAIAIYVLKVNPRGQANRAYALLILFVGVWLWGEFMTGIAHDAKTAWYWSRFMMSGVMFIPAAFLYFTQVVPYETSLVRNRAFLYLPFAVSVVFLALVLGSDLVIGEVTVRPYGYDQEIREAYPFYVAFFFMCVLYGLYSLFQRYRTFRTSIEKEQILYVLVGTFIPTVLGGTIDLLLPLLGITNIPTTASSLSIFMAAFLAYAVVKYRFLVEPIYECDFRPADVPPRGKDIEAGQVYLVRDGDPYRGLDLFAEEVGRCSQGLCITDKVPEEVRKRYGLAKTPVISSSGGNPKRLEELLVTVRKFIKMAPHGVVIIDGLDSMAVQYSVRSVKHFLLDILPDLETGGSSLLLSYGPGQGLEELEEAIASYWTDSAIKAISNPLRLRILELLEEEGPMGFAQLAQRLGMADTPPKLSFHLSILRKTGLIAQDPEKNYLLGRMGRMALQTYREIGEGISREVAL